MHFDIVISDLNKFLLDDLYR